MPYLWVFCCLRQQALQCSARLFEPLFAQQTKRYVESGRNLFVRVVLGQLRLLPIRRGGFAWRCPIAPQFPINRCDHAGEKNFHDEVLQSGAVSFMQFQHLGDITQSFAVRRDAVAVADDGIFAGVVGGQGQFEIVAE